MHVEVLIVGGAVMGSSTAYFLAQHDRLRGQILVVDTDLNYRRAASALSTSGFRQQFSTAVNIELSRFSSQFIREANRILDLPGAPAGIPLHEAGYLYLGNDAQRDGFAANHRLQRSLGVDVALLDRSALKQSFPWLSLDEVAVGSLGMSGEGWLDGYLLTMAFRRNAQRRGAIYRQATVNGLRLRPDGLFEAALNESDTVTARNVVDCAGTSAPAIAAMLGIDVPVSAQKQSVFCFDSPFACPNMPFVFTPDGLFVRPEGNGYIAGIGISGEEETPLDDWTVDHGLFDDKIWPLLAGHIPGFERVRFKGAWAGHYDMSRLDHNPFIGPVAEIPNFYLASGFSGHGLMQSPGIGRALSELIVEGAYRTIDLGALAFHRIESGRPVFEGIQY